MDDLIIIKKNQENQVKTYSPTTTSTQLLHRENGFEAIEDTMIKGTTGFISSDGKGNYEFCYILSGNMEINNGDKVLHLSAGDSYYYSDLNRNVPFRVIEDTRLLSVSNNKIYDVIKNKQNKLIEILNDLQLTDGDTLEHCKRVKSLCLGIAYCLHVDPIYYDDLFYASYFHDVGKAKIPSSILTKPGKLTEEEYEIMKMHSIYTYEMIKQYCGEKVAEIAYQHHERLDGKGYPRGLKNNEIGILARIICCADAYDAIVVTRPYHQGLSKNDALKELRRCVGTQFDQKVIDALEEHLSTI
ncbi:HD domain-containing phosphohydrolase [Anaerorhabdus sp.]|uniref:HD domain-containing phosphohydrolase n=1 Tax=Anaerorhabdus sp. TaxID=1872524 RepID=UPI002FC8E8B0